MRIIGGEFGGRILHPPKNLPVRPTTDMAKTGLFNILTSRLNFEETTVLDLCCGTGNISFECASRGAKKITAVDLHGKCVKFVNETAKAMNMPALLAFKADIFKFIESGNQVYDFIFADPPYEAEWIEEISQAVFLHKILSPKGILVIEHSAKTKLANQKNFVETRKYGNVNFSIFRHHEQ